MADLRQSPPYAAYLKKIGWQVEKLQIANGRLQIFIKNLPFIGSIIKIQRPEKIPFEKIDNIAKKYRALFVKLEPKQCNNRVIEQLSHHGYKPSSPVLPTKTLQLDLTSSQEQIFSKFKKDARYEIKKAERNNLRLLISQYPNILISNFVSLWQKNAWSRGFWLPIKKEIESLYQAFDKNAYLLTASYYNNIYYHSKLLAGALIVIYDNVAYYFYAASSPEGKKLSASYLVVWEAIKLAKRKGCRIFDFEGIYDERFPNKSWLGFTHFKKSFGGKEVEYPGSFIKFFNPILKFLSPSFVIKT